jgi:hypothetical protein
MAVRNFSKVGKDYLIHERITLNSFEWDDEDLEHGYKNSVFCREFVKKHRETINTKLIESLGDNFTCATSIEHAIQTTQDELVALQTLAKIAGKDAAIRGWGDDIEIRRLASPEEAANLKIQEEKTVERSRRRAQNAAQKKLEKEARTKAKDLAKLEELQAKYKEDLKNGKS